ncbi:hypothetical protein HY484_04145 [Candidatus Woesearchaeota archaeon]|nr:hypothetical protein [Candidatus Woesearchaeota archaeon]
MATKGKATVIKKKRWITILAPKMFNEQPIGETYISDFSEAKGRNVSVSLTVITGDPQKQNIVLNFTMTGSTPNAITTTPTGYRLTPAAVRKTMRRAKSKVEDSFKLTTSDNKPAVIKPILVTKNRTKGAVLRNLRRTLKAYLTKKITSTTFENVILDLVTHRLQRELLDLLKKVYPLSTCEIKHFGQVKQKQTITQPVAEIVAQTELSQEQAVAAA